jgi:hypothetical protein
MNYCSTLRQQPLVCPLELNFRNLTDLRLALSGRGFPFSITVPHCPSNACYFRFWHKSQLSHLPPRSGCSTRYPLHGQGQIRPFELPLVFYESKRQRLGQRCLQVSAGCFYQSFLLPDVLLPTSSSSSSSGRRLCSRWDFVCHGLSCA